MLLSLAFVKSPLPLFYGCRQCHSFLHIHKQPTHRYAHTPHALWKSLLPTSSSKIRTFTPHHVCTHTHTHTKKWGHDHSSGYSALSPSPPPSRAHIFLLSTFSLRIFPRSVALTPNIYTIQPAIPHTKWKSERKKEEEEEKEEDEEEKKRRGYIHVIP